VGTRHAQDHAQCAARHRAVDTEGFGPFAFLGESHGNQRQRRRSQQGRKNALERPRTEHGECVARETAQGSAILTIEVSSTTISVAAAITASASQRRESATTGIENV